MPSYSDIYVISKKRDRKTIEEFLNQFLPARDETADEYEFPQYSDNPEIIFSTAEEALGKIIADPELDYRIYWRALNEAKPEHAMVFFLADGYVIFGLSTDDAYPEYVSDLLSKMKSFLGSSLGYIGHEASPDADSIEQFKREIDLHRP